MLYQRQIDMTDAAQVHRSRGGRKNLRKYQSLLQATALAMVTAHSRAIDPLGRPKAELGHPSQTAWHSQKPTRTDRTG